ncbi:MAG: hypothetical protein ACPGRX_03840 [Bdellovibrionales bacterium]
MRKLFTKKPKPSRAQVEKQAVAALRETRAKLLQDHPDLMQKMAVLANMSQTSQPQAVPFDETHVDKQKNISTVLKFLENKDDKPALRVAVKAMLSKHLQ